MDLKQRVDMTQGNPYKNLILFSIPLLLGNFFQQLYNTADSAIVGQILGEKALAAVGLGFPFMAIMFCVYVGLGMATTIMVAQAIGAKDEARVNLIFNTIYRLCVISIVPITFLGIIALDPVLHLLKVPEDGTFVMSSAYLKVIFLGLITTMGFNINTGLLQGLGDSITSLKLLAVASVANIGLDYLMVGPLEMGVAGAAWATVAAQGISWILGLIIINKRYAYINLNILKLSYDRDLGEKAIRMGIPTALQNALYSVGALTFYSIITAYGSDFLAGFSGANKLDMFAFTTVQSFANATTTYVGQNLGAKNLERARDGLRSGLILNVGTAIITSSLCYIFSTPLLMIFGDGAGMIQSGEYYLHTVLPFYFILAVFFTYNGALRGVGQMNIPLLASLISLWGVRVPTAFYIADKFGKEYIFFSYGLGWTVGALIVLGFYYFGSWKKDLELRISAEINN